MCDGGGIRMLGGGSVMGGMGMRGGGMPGGGGGNGIMVGRMLSSTIRGSFPWSNGQRSPETQKPFSIEERGLGDVHWN